MVFKDTRREYLESLKGTDIDKEKGKLANLYNVVTDASTKVSFNYNYLKWWGSEQTILTGLRLQMRYWAVEKAAKKSHDIMEKMPNKKNVEDAEKQIMHFSKVVLKQLDHQRKHIYKHQQEKHKAQEESYNMLLEVSEKYKT